MKALGRPLMRADFPARRKPLNLHRMNAFRPDSLRVFAWGEGPRRSGTLTAPTRGRTLRRRQVAVANNVDLQSNYEILKPPPIGHFIEFSLRAPFTACQSGHGRLSSLYSLPIMARGRSLVLLCYKLLTGQGIGPAGAIVKVRWASSRRRFRRWKTCIG